MLKNNKDVISVKLKTRKLKAMWNLELAEDLRGNYGISIFGQKKLGIYKPPKKIVFIEEHEFCV